MALDADQKRAYTEVLKERQSILLTSEAGCGKSYTINAIVRAAREANLQVGVTAMTGSAAQLINGRTLHSFLGIGLASKDATDLAQNTKMKLKKVYKVLRQLDIIIVDEVSMLDASLCDKISAYLQLIRQDSQPFGGLQIVFCGDLLQLRPVRGEYCFKSAEWSRLNPKVITLKCQYRQSGDSAFQLLLSRVRWGQCSTQDLETLSLCKNRTFPADIEPTKVYSLNVDVDTINSFRFEEVCKTCAPDQIIKYPTAGCVPKNSYIPESVTLCPGLQIVVTWNIPGSLSIVNGTRGRVLETRDNNVLIQLVNGMEHVIEYIEYCPDDSMPSTSEKNVVRFMPLKLAYAVSVHKTQGMTLDCMEVDLGKSIFEYGQAYTALSRAKSLDSVRIVKVCAKSFKAHPEVVLFYTESDFKDIPASVRARVQRV